MGGAILSAAGIGAIICPPALGAAAFIIAEFLHITYLKVIVMADDPGPPVLLLDLPDDRGGHAPRWRAVHPARNAAALALTKRHGYHFLAVVGIPLMLVLGMSAFRAVFCLDDLAVALSFVRPRRRRSGRDGCSPRSRQARAACCQWPPTTATAGIIVGTVTLTGLGLKISGLIVDLAGGYLFLTVLYSALAIWMLGLAVPVTASYIIAAVMVAPAMMQGRRARPRGAHVHLLLRRAVGGEPADRALAVCRGGASPAPNRFRR